MSVFDFKLARDFGHTPSTAMWKGVTHVFWPICLLADHEPVAKTRIQEMCATLPKQLQAQEILML